MNDFAAALAPSPLLYAQAYDAARDMVLFVRLDEAQVRAASFLDDRILTPGMERQWHSWPMVEQAAVAIPDALPLHFIFHTGHVGSTLLSRLVDETAPALGLREPLPLRTLAQMLDARAPAFDTRLGVFLKLWRRVFRPGQVAVVKATSSSGRAAPALLRTSPASRAVYLNLRAEPYLATLLAGANAMVDLKGFEAERTARLRTMLGGTDIRAASVGELAALSWLAESLTRARVLSSFTGRVFPLDFDRMLADLPAAMESVLRHFDLPFDAAFVAQIARSTVLTRYSKAPQQYEYSPHFRAQLLAQARAEHAGEIRRGLVWLEALAKTNTDVAAVL
jgi:hypothetical protein